MKAKQAFLVSPVITILLVLGETNLNDAMNMTMAIVASVLPVLVLVLVLKMLFRSFGEISKMNSLRASLRARLLRILPILVLIGDTTTSFNNPWNTNMDIWSTITGIVILVLPFLVLIIVLRSIFRYFSREW